MPSGTRVPMHIFVEESGPDNGVDETDPADAAKRLEVEIDRLSREAHWPFELWCRIVLKIVLVLIKLAGTSD